jgi:hypothetical protein
VLACQQLYYYYAEAFLFKITLLFPSVVTPSPEFPFEFVVLEHSGMPLIIFCGYLAIILSSIMSDSTADVIDSQAQRLLMICKRDVVQSTPSAGLFKNVVWQFLIIRKFL